MGPRECEGIRLSEKAEMCRWRALLAYREDRQEDEARYTAEADGYDAQVLAILERDFAVSKTIPAP